MIKNIAKHTILFYLRTVLIRYYCFNRHCDCLIERGFAFEYLFNSYTYNDFVMHFRILIIDRRRLIVSGAQFISRRNKQFIK